jgi:putative ABC transport system permease protein
MGDIRYAVRSLGKQPVFTLVALLTLALGIGANTAIFSLVHGVLLKPLPYPDSDRLIFVWNTYPLMGLQKATVSIPDYLDRRAQAPAIEESALFTGIGFTLSEDGRPERVRGLRVTPTFFSLYQTVPAIGQPFTAEHATPGNDKQVILSHTLWTTRFAGDRSIVGRDIRLSGEAYRVAGVMPEDFLSPGREIALWVPFAFTPEQMADTARGNEFSTMVARLRRGATIEQANSQITAIVKRNIERLPTRAAFAVSSGFGGYAIPYRDEIIGDIRTPLFILQAGVLLVLLIACANVANLQLIRATARHKELAIRAALGAGEWTLIRQLLIEGLVLSIAGGLLGIAVGLAGMQALLSIGTTQLPRAGEVALDANVLLFTAALAVVTGIVFGLAPGLTLVRGRVHDVIKEDGRGASASRRTSLTRHTLVIGEMALALVLLIGAALLLKSFARIQDVNPGFDSANILTAQLGMPRDPAAARLYFDELLRRVRVLPGVTAASAVRAIPFSDNSSTGSYGIVGYTPGPREPAPHGRINVVETDYFKVMGIPLMRGRLIEPGDTEKTPRIVVVDQFLADRYFKGSDPIGRQITRGGPTQAPWTIVGVVGTINGTNLGEVVAKETIYIPAKQIAPQPLALVVKTAVAPQSLVQPVRAALQEVDPDQPLYEVRTMEERLAMSLETRRTPMMLLVAFGAIALVLAAIGIYGVLAYTVSQRVRELGIRQALGAERGDILRMVMRQGLTLAAIGIVAGGVASFWLATLLKAQLFGVTPRDPVVFVAGPAILLLVAFAACCLPAFRATRIDPVVALRDG